MVVGFGFGQRFTAKQKKKVYPYSLSKNKLW